MRVALASALLMGAYAGQVFGQGLARGAQDEDVRGDAVAGPLGAINAAIGTANDILGIHRRERFRVYALGERRPSCAYRGRLRVGTILPEEDVVCYDVPAEFALPDYDDTVVNEHPDLSTLRLAA